MSTNKKETHSIQNTLQQTITSIEDQLSKQTDDLIGHTTLHAAVKAKESDKSTINSKLLNTVYTKTSDSITHFKQTAKQEKEINHLREQISELIEDKKNEQEHKDDLADLIKQLESKEAINHIYYRIHRDAARALFEDMAFKDHFIDGQMHEAVVISIDIRRSTDLMLKAKSPKVFSEFITTLTDELSRIIISNYGVFDKFTGDGILAFFPKFLSGKEAIVRALKAAQECHDVFEKHYWSYKNSFNVFIKDIGLGIGIDYGQVHLVNKRKELTVVGIPVVYACRLSNAKAGETLLNLSAYEEFKEVYTGPFQSEEEQIFIKNEGEALVYKVEFKKEILLQEKPETIS